MRPLVMLLAVALPAAALQPKPRLQNIDSRRRYRTRSLQVLSSTPARKTRRGALRATPTDEPDVDGGLDSQRRNLGAAAGAAALAALGYAAFGEAQKRGVEVPDAQALLATLSAKVEELGPYGPLYFAGVYVAAEVLALPAVPLTASAGYLFGAVQGTALVLCSATVAAGVSFWVGRTLLRGWVEGIAGDSAQFAAIDKAVRKEGFKVVLLLRLSPIFPFALSSYLYGLTAVEFGPYLLATLLGFAPGTFLTVYGGEVASVLQQSGDAQDGSSLPWYFYAGILGIGAGLAAKVTEIANAALEEAGGITKEEN
ncbi:snare associated Golgi protein-domain-containing protein [Pelagophyceae sp. CCMP2097]|nr:snare associated Golgi protein-domain-containing protein [Pelagophyceae sp. CCMP2097]